MSDTIIDYIAAVSLTTILMIVVGAVIFYALSVWADHKQRILEHEETLRLAEIEASMTHLTDLQTEILAQNYVPEMEIIYEKALQFAHEPDYLDELERFRNRYPQAHALWVRHRGMDSSLDEYMSDYLDWDKLQS